MTVDYLLPDRMHPRVSLGGSPARMETIAIGSKVWSNQGRPCLPEGTLPEDLPKLDM